MLFLPVAGDSLSLPNILCQADKNTYFSVRIVSKPWQAVHRREADLTKWQTGAESRPLGP
jgi:hypothetical protein